MTSRDDFTPKVKLALAKRAAFICANPDCKVMTLAPSLVDVNKFQYCGIAAHITAAGEGGPRFDATLTPLERASVDNGIFLCSNCAGLVDKNNGIDYPVLILKDWKGQHDNWVLAHLNKRLADQAKFHQIESIITGGKSYPIVWLLGHFNFGPDGRWHQVHVDLMLECRGEHPLKNVEVSHSGEGYVSTTVEPTQFSTVYPNQPYKRLGTITFEQAYVEQFPRAMDLSATIGMATQGIKCIAENAEFIQRTTLGVIRGHPLAPPVLTGLYTTITRREHQHGPNDMKTVFESRFHPSGPYADWTVETVLATESIAKELGLLGTPKPIQRYADRKS